MEYPLNMRYYTTPEYAGELTRRNNIYNEMVRRQSQPVVSSETPLKVSMGLKFDQKNHSDLVRMRRMARMRGPSRRTSGEST
ncbi:unnamed protein product [Nesidiocoris tenuis]|uniref:Uncharacterized protein n=1 Tax=Nesidiocoris tenuis TaxID=355587 RepID=A0A6H5G7I3_9HEMI|nr:unnamed protein product [Nesidiocoris tenuis]